MDSNFHFMSSVPLSDNKKNQRSLRWQLNVPLALKTLALGTIAILGGAGSYWYHSAQASTTFFQRAQAAASAKDFVEQGKWLNRYSLMAPDDRDAIVQLAIAADDGVEQADSDTRAIAIDQARKQLSTSLARLGEAEPNDKTITDLRGRLINRLLQLGGPWYREAERQVILLQAPLGDASATRWLALALSGQVDSATYQERRPNKYSQELDYWNWLAQQKVGEVVSIAIDKNKKDLDLIARFVDAAQTKPNLFVQPGDFSRGDSFRVGSSPERSSEPEAPLEHRVDLAIKPIEANRDSRSQLIVYQVKRTRGEDGHAVRRLGDAAALASERLASKQLADDHADKDSTGGINEVSDSYWDYVLVLEAAIQVTKEDAPLANKWYEQLMANTRDDVPKTITESVFVNAGRLKLMEGKADAAAEIWQQGIKRLDSDSLDLLGSLATLLCQNEPSSPRATVAIENFRQAISKASTKLTRTTVAQVPPAQRASLGRMIDAASWRLSVLDARVALSRGNMVTAMDHFRRAADATVDVNATEKLGVLTQLASLYGRQGLWDQAALTLQKAVELDPANLSLRGQTADAWARSGNRSQAEEQWRLAAGSDSPAIQIASAEALFNYQLRQNPEQRDLSGVRSIVKRSRDQLNVNDKAGSPPASEENARAARRLDLLELLLPPSGVAVEQHLHSETMINRLIELSRLHNSDEAVQAFAAERLAGLGRVDESNQALQRLEAILGPSSTSLVVVRARIEAANGDPIAASTRLLEHVEWLAQSKPDEAVADSLIALATDFASQGNAPELAYRALSRIPNDRLTLSMVYGLARLAKNLPADSKFLHVTGEPLSPEKLSLQWEEQLREQEGETGAYWRFLYATRLIDQLRKDSKSIAMDDSRLKEARTLVSEILTSRPRWGDAISLDGSLSVIEGRAEQAIEQLRRGIAAGDRRLQTRHQLIELLILLDRDAEAEEEIRSASFSINANVDKYATTQIQLAQRQGEFVRSLKVAEEAVEQRPDDFLSHVVLCITATVAATETEDNERRTQWLKQASSEIELAEQLAGANEPAIYSARLRLNLARGDNESIRNEISRIDNLSRLDDFTKLMLKSQTHLALGEYEDALPLLVRADELRPTMQSQLAIYQVYRTLRREAEALASLQLAHRRNPQDPTVRNELARSLAARDGSNVDWNELSKLLSNNDQVTSSNRLMHAVLLGTQGNEEHQTQGTTILRELIQEKNDRSDDAARLLAVLLKKQMDAIPQENTETRNARVTEIREIYDSLVQRTDPLAVDLYRYANLLLELEQEQDLAKVYSLLQTLENVREGSIPSLEIGIRYFGRMNKRDSVPEFIATWANRAMKDESREDSRVYLIAAETLLKVGFNEASLPWYELAYRTSADTLPNYILALNQVGQSEKAIAICTDRYQQHPDALTATLLVESLLNNSVESETSFQQRLIQDAVSKFSEDLTLLESVATLRLQQNKFDDAIALYSKVRKIDPLRIRTLNNLAMALSSTAGRAAEGLDPINQALKLAGDNPELLDTKGVVLLKAGRLDEARDVFQNAIHRSNEPRFQFHLIVTLMAMEKKDEARRLWQSLDLTRLNLSGLTATEQQKLAAMKIDFSS